MNKEELTIKQKELYDIIKEYIKQNKFSPSIRDLRKIKGVNSTDTIHSMLRVLRRKGYINYIDGIARSITITGENNE